MLIHSCNVPWNHSAPRLLSLEAKKKKKKEVGGCLFDGLDYLLPPSTSIGLREVVLRPRGLMTSISMYRKVKKKEEKKKSDRTQKLFVLFNGAFADEGSNMKESSQRWATKLAIFGY